MKPYALQAIITVQSIKGIGCNGKFLWRLTQNSNLSFNQRKIIHSNAIAILWLNESAGLIPSMRIAGLILKPSDS